MTSQKKAVRNFGSLFGVQIVNYLFPLVVIPIVVRIIGPSNYGIINYVNTIVSYFILLIGFSFELSAVRLVTINSDNQAKINLIFNQVFFARIILFVISTFIFCLLFVFLSDLRNERLVAVFTYLMCISTIFDPTWFFTAKQDIHRTAIFSFITKTFLNIGLLCFIKKESDYIFQPLIISISQIVVLFSAFVWAIRHYNLRIYFPGIKSVRLIIWSDKMLFFHSFSHTIYTTLNIVVLGILTGPIEVGYYTAAWKLILIIQALLISPLGVVLFPIISEAFNKNRDVGIKIIQKSIPTVLFITILICLFILTFGKISINILYGQKFNNSILLFKLLSFIPMVIAVNMILGIQTMVNLKMDKKFFTITISAACLSLLLSLILIHLYGASGAAVSWFLTELFCTVAMYIVLKKNKVKILNFEYFNMHVILSFLLPTMIRIRERFKRTITF